VQAQDQTPDEQASAALAQKLARLQDSLQMQQAKNQAAQARAQRAYDGAMTLQAALQRLQDMRMPEIEEAAELADVFAEWNKGELDSYLIEITAQIFKKMDPETGKPLVDVILARKGHIKSKIW